jgi:steroid 5-alpha reductase family enzyme
MGHLATVAIADVVGTIIIFVFSYVYDNSSFYDPYWSIIPICIAAYFGILGWENGVSPVRLTVVFSLVTFWGIRLTYNWARGWPGLHHQDWRYDDLQEQNGKWYWLVSFSGIHLFPTVLVYLGCLSLYPAMVMEGGNPLRIWDVLAFTFTLGAILTEAVADQQLRHFMMRKKPGQTLITGLWRYSRHPNYFGETAFWWGLFFCAMAAHPEEWWVVVGPLSMTLLFNFISIPMIDKRMKRRRKNYDLVQKAISRWIPWRPNTRHYAELEKKMNEIF